jgi:acetyl esterase/lipase
MCGMHRSGFFFSRICAYPAQIPSSTTGFDSPDGIRSIDFSFPSQIEYDHVDSPHDIMARLYHPVNMTGKIPLLLYFHGGGFVICSGRNFVYDRVLRDWAKKANIMILTVDYRLAPENPFPASLYDSYSAYSWLCSLHNQSLSQTIVGDYDFIHHVDADRIVTGGDSSGANLAYRLAYIVRDKRLPIFPGYIADSQANATISVPHLHLKTKYTLYLFPGMGESSTRGDYRDSYMLTENNIKFFKQSYIGPFLEKNETAFNIEMHYVFPPIGTFLLM